MLGLPDFWIWSAYILCVLSTILCVAYGFYNWNNGSDDEAIKNGRVEKWQETQKEVETNL